MNNNINFAISGSPRSGTTLLSAFLSNQKDIFVLNTPNVFFGQYNCYATFNNENQLKIYIEDSLKNLKKRNRLYNLSKSYYENLSACSDNLLKDVKYPVKLIELYPKIIEILSKEHSFKFLGISDDVLKNAQYYTFKHYLNVDRFIYLIKNPIVQCISYLSYLGIDKDEAVKVYKSYFNEQTIPILFHHKSHVVKYEELVINPEKKNGRNFKILGCKK